MDKISYSIKVSEEGRPTTLDTRQEEFKPLVEKYERRNMWNSCILIFKKAFSSYLYLSGILIIPFLTWASNSMVLMLSTVFRTNNF